MSAPPSALRRKGVGIALLIAFALSPLLWERLTPNVYSGGRSQDPGARQERNASAVGMMLGEFRTSLSDILLIKTERYLHSGVGYIPHMDELVQGTAAEMEAMDSHQQEVAEEAAGGGGEEEGYATLILSPERDFRGLIGELQREVKPWLHESTHAAHTDGRQLLPWFRIATLSDPNHVQAYTLGAYWLGVHDRPTSKTYLIEGLENNPDAFQLHLMMGYHVLREARFLPGDVFEPSPEQRVLVDQARSSFLRAAELALEQRPHDNPDDTPTWGGYDENDAWASFRMASLSELYYGDSDQAAALAQQFIDVAGADPTLERVIRRASR